MATPLETALQLLSVGWSPIPIHGIREDGVCTCGSETCKSPGKHPIQKQWASLPRMSAPDLYAIWESYPEANVGIRTGTPSGIFVVDVDAGGLEAMQQLINQRGWVDTLTVRTGSGMWHFYFTLPEGVRVTNSSKGLPQGVDIRGDGGQVVAPPSRTQKGAYEVVNNVPPAQAPAWLLEILAAQAHDETPLIDGPVVKRPPTASEAAYEKNLVGKQLERLRKLRAKRWAPGDSWDQTCFEVACHLIEMANAEFSSLTHGQAYQLYMEAAPFDDEWDDRKAKWESAIKRSGNKAKVDTPPMTLDQLAPQAQGFVEAAPQAAEEIVERITASLGIADIVGANAIPSDAQIVAEFCQAALLGRAVYTKEMGWLIWNGKVWAQGELFDVREMFRRYMLWRVEQAPPSPEKEEVEEGAFDERGFLKKYLTAGRIKAISDLAIGIMRTDFEHFDRKPDLLVAANGTVDLRTGELRPHDATDLLTKMTKVEYHPGATHPDWDACLAALRDDTKGWMQLRLGQAITGYTTPDDLMPICQGGGENGKTTLFAAVRQAVGEYAVTASERMLLAQPGAHPTELMPLRGARIAVIEETPQGGMLNVKRLKDVVGAERMVARHVNRDNVEWETTHSVFLTTNHPPKIAETDHGTWRRICLVVFPFRFVNEPEEELRDGERRGDPQIKLRMRNAGQGRLEAVLAWLVEGAKAWYANPNSLSAMPMSVKMDTATWRSEADKLYAYIMERIEFSPGHRVLSQELFADFNDWLAVRRTPPWSDQLFVSRFKEHPLVMPERVMKRRIRGSDGLSRRPGAVHIGVLPHDQNTMWEGIKFRDDAQALINPAHALSLAN